MLKKITKPFRHNFGLFTGLLICAAVLVWAFGCESSTKSLTDPTLNVTRVELDAEIEALSTKIDLAYGDIARQDEMKQQLLNIGLAYATGQGVSPVGIVATLAGVAGLGAVIDNRRKDAIIKSKEIVVVNTPKKIARRKA